MAQRSRVLAAFAITRSIFQHRHVPQALSRNPGVFLHLNPMCLSGSQVLRLPLQKLDAEFPDKPLYPSDPALAADAEAFAELERGLTSAGYRRGTGPS